MSMKPKTTREMVIKILADCVEINSRLDRIEKKIFDGLERDVIELKASQRTIKWSLEIGLSILGTILSILIFVLIIVK